MDLAIVSGNKPHTPVALHQNRTVLIIPYMAEYTLDSTAGALPQQV